METEFYRDERGHPKGKVISFKMKMESQSAKSYKSLSEQPKRHHNMLIDKQIKV